MVLTALIALAALIVAIVVASQLGALRARLDALEKKLTNADPAPVQSVASTAVPPPLPTVVQNLPPKSSASSESLIPVRQATPAINWESFVGVRLFAWIGGLALFLGIVFFVKYAFENNLISPPIRVLAGGAIGLALICLGLLPFLRRYRIPAQSLIATGVLILYADTYAACSFYNLVSLTVASVLMWIVTAIAFGLAARMDAPGIMWLGLTAGFVTPFLFGSRHTSPVTLFGYIGVLNCGIAAVSALKRWQYFMFAAAICTVVVEFLWAAGFFGRTDAESTRILFFVFQGLFLLVAIALARSNRANRWSVAAAAIAGFAPLIAFAVEPLSRLTAWDFGLITLAVAAPGLIVLVALHRDAPDEAKLGPAILSIALLLVCVGEWRWWYAIVDDRSLNDASLAVTSHMGAVAGWHILVFLVFASAPYICGDRRTWPWVVAAAAGPPQFWLVHYYVTTPAGLTPGRPVVPHELAWVIPIAFAIPAAVGIYYLVRRQRVDLASGDSRLASQGAAVITFLSLIFPVQFQREWITLGWAIEGLGLILLFRLVPNRKLRAAALIVFSAAFVRLALNPAVLYYHPRSHTPILNWYLYAYGIAALCFFAGAYLFGEPRQRLYERHGSAILYSFGGIVCFLLLNIEIADYFSIGPTLTFSFAGNFARDMIYTVSWSVFAFVMLIIGMFRQMRALRFAAVALLCLALAKLFLHDLDNLNQLYRIVAFISVAIIAMVASFAYQRFLTTAPKEAGSSRT